jgi:hypothetical protein
MSLSSFVRIITVAAVISCFMPVSARAEDKGVQASLDATPELVGVNPTPRRARRLSIAPPNIEPTTEPALPTPFAQLRPISEVEERTIESCYSAVPLPAQFGPGLLPGRLLEPPR